MKKFKILILILIATIGKTFSQENNQQPVTIYFNNETLKKGNLEFDITEFQNFEFYSNTSSNKEKISADEVRLITDASNNEIYKSYQYNNKKFLMKLLVGGDIDLYYFIDENSNQHYITESKEFGRKELIQTIDTKKIDSKSYSVSTKQFIGTMKVLFKDCISEDIENTRFKLKSLSKEFEDYNNCKGNLTYSSSIPNEKPEIRLALISGGNFTRIETHYETLVEDFDTSTGLTVGAEISYIPMIIDSKITAVFGIFYTNKGGVANSLRQSFDKLEVDYQAMELSFSLRYNFFKHNKKINPFLGIGLNKGFLLNDESQRLTTISDNGDRRPYENSAIAVNANTFNLGPQFEGGLNYLLNEKSGVILKAMYFNSTDKNEIFKAKGFSIQAGYLIRF